MTRNENELLGKFMVRIGSVGFGWLRLGSERCGTGGSRAPRVESQEGGKTQSPNMGGGGVGVKISVKVSTHR
jgi:hypothetical protein